MAEITSTDFRHLPASVFGPWIWKRIVRLQRRLRITPRSGANAQAAVKELIQEIRIAWRRLMRVPLFAVISVLLLALAICANTIAFSVYHGLFLKPLPYPQEDRLVMVFNSYPKAGVRMAGTSIPDFVDRREQVDALEELAIYNSVGRALEGDGLPEHLLLLRVSPSMFRVLGVEPLLGRAFTEEESIPGQDRVIVLSHSLWKTRFGAQSDIVGTYIRLDGEAFHVLGVLPPTLSFPRRDYDAWVPYGWMPEAAADGQRFKQDSLSVGRMRPGATIERLQEEMDAVISRNAEHHAKTRDWIESAGFTGAAMPVREFIVGDLRTTALVMQAIMFAILLVACIDLGSLQLTRVAGRRVEFAVRTALGARSGALVRPMLLECGLLSIGGLLFGLVLAWAGLGVVAGLGLDRTNHGFDYNIDTMVLGFAVLISVIATFGTGALAALHQSTRSPARLLRALARTAGSDREGNRLRNMAVVVQLAVSMALVASAGTLAARFIEVTATGPGFETRNILTARFWLPEERYPDYTSRSRFVQQVLSEVSSLPHVNSAAYTAVLPLSGNRWAGGFAIDGRDEGAGTPGQNANIRSVSGDYFRTLSIPLLRGRLFEDGDPDRVVVIDEMLADRYWPDADPLGARIRINDESEWSTIIGVVPTIRHEDLVSPVERGTTYWPVVQRTLPDGLLVVRANVAPELIVRTVQDAVLTIDPGIPLSDVRSFESRLHDVLGPQRTTLILATSFATVAFVLAIIGLYGVLSWFVLQQQREIGLRMALGADYDAIVMLVLARASVLLVFGVAVGVAMALGFGTLMAAHLPYVGGVSPYMIVGSCLTLITIGMLAAWLPAHRAGRLSPVEALRSE